MTDKIKLVIVEDQQMVRDSLIKSIGEDPEFTIVGDTGNAGEALALCRDVRPDIILMDVCTENDESGITAARDIKTHMPEVKVVIMTGMMELRFIELSKAAGADSFIYKNINLNEMISILKGTSQGYSTYPMAKPISMDSKFFDLTKREQEILLLMCGGQSRKEIADSLNLAESSVKSYISNILSKTGFNSTAKLVVHVISNGYLNPKIN
ncbi:MAG: response regulator transcription factor [Peptostreptococcaceae bacterium]|nr:response regulator transcription factor [Peptostreptococcaceae bacterium]MDY5739028.1 response regulator transcription factor [Anaerovoracaceae bacterium]